MIKKVDRKNGMKERTNSGFQLGLVGLPKYSPYLAYFAVQLRLNVLDFLNLFLFFLLSDGLEVSFLTADELRPIHKIR